MIKIKEGYINPSENQRVIVKLEDGSITGAVYKPTTYKELHDYRLFEGYNCVGLFNSKPVAWCGIPEEWED
ncbi:MAG: hypothetical protein GY928_08170 [Colwellia sp.]|nr:hypothetical protein [Colwellia sp.]